jgi:CubicO group peptidase (beta-lactamase class C family)
MTHTPVMADWDTFIPNRTEGCVDMKTWLFWPYFAVGDGNIVTTIGDLAKWDENFYHPIVGDAAIVAAMTTGGTTTRPDSPSDA